MLSSILLIPLLSASWSTQKIDATQQVSFTTPSKLGHASFGSDITAADLVALLKTSQPISTIDHVAVIDRLRRLEHAIIAIAKHFTSSRPARSIKHHPLATAYHDNYRSAADDDESLEVLLHFDNAMKLVGELDDLLQPLSIPLSMVCAPCGTAWNLFSFGACMWNNRGALTELGLNMQTFELAWCSSNIAGLLPGGGVGGLVASNLKRTTFAILPVAQDYLYGTNAAPSMDIGFGSYWFGSTEATNKNRTEPTNRGSQHSVTWSQREAARKRLLENLAERNSERLKAAMTEATRRTSSAKSSLSTGNEGSGENTVLFPPGSSRQLILEKPRASSSLRQYQMAKNSNALRAAISRARKENDRAKNGRHAVRLALRDHVRLVAEGKTDGVIGGAIRIDPIRRPGRLLVRPAARQTSRARLLVRPSVRRRKPYLQFS